MDASKQYKLLTQARVLIGTSYAKMDCSHFVHQAYDSAGMAYPYLSSGSFDSKPNEKYFTHVGSDLTAARLEAGDVIVFKGHMGLWDPEGCQVLTGNAECVQLKGQAPFLSSRSGGDRGPDYAPLSYWKGKYEVYRWAK